MMNMRQMFPAMLFGLLLFAGCRQDMHDQPRFKPLSKSDFYTDLRSSRPLVEGTVARGQLHEDAYLYTGMMANSATPGDYMPFPVTHDVLARGRERFNIYCTPCHSRLGDGKGIVPSRGFAKMPPSFHISRLQRAPLGYFFDVITHGFGVMPDYSAQINPQDRWAIVAYIRALQLSQNAPGNEIPAGQQIPSPAPRLRGDPPSGATLPEFLPESAPPSPRTTNKLERSQ